MSFLTVSLSPPLRHQYGAALVEFTIVSLPLLLCGLALPEAARWQLVRQVAHLALVEAGRAGATEHAQPAVMQAAFEQALLPLHAGNHAAQRLQTAFKRVQDLTGLPPWRIEILQPSPDVFRDFADPGLHITRTLGRPAIRNDFQTEQHARHRAVWPGGVGPVSGKTIFEANVLRLRLIYLHEPMLPLLRALIKKLGNAAGSYGQRAMAQGGMLPLTLEIDMDMQSHGVDWSGLALPSDARVIPGGQATNTIMPPTATPTSSAYTGARPAIAAAAIIEPNDVASMPALSSDIAALPVDLACGVALCCVSAK